MSAQLWRAAPYSCNAAAGRKSTCRSHVQPFKAAAAAAAAAAAQGSVGPAAALRPAKYAPRSDNKGSLRLFLNSADISLWEKYQNGSLYGFTTNPLILERDNVPCTMASFRCLVEAAKKLQAHEVQIQAWGGSAQALEAAALRILDLDPAFITIKLPCTSDGLAAASALVAKDDSLSITITGVYTPHQVLMAQAVGANYVAPYLGRMSDGNVGTLEASLRELPSDNPTSNRSYGMQVALETVLSMQAAVDKAGSSMRILVASIRQAEQMAMLAAHGCNTFTFSPDVMEQLVSVPSTLQAAADFEAAAARNGAEW